MISRIKISFALVALFVLTFLSVKAFADDRILRPYKVDIKLGYAHSSASSLIPGQAISQKFGIAFSVEPKYGFTDNFWIGLRLEAAAISIQTDPFVGIGTGSTLLTGEYSILVTKDFRPFIGLGLGPYFQKGIYKNSNDDPNNNFVTNIGFAPRIGFEYRHFCLGIEYNIIQDSFDYFGFKLGFLIGGNKD